MLSCAARFAAEVLDQDSHAELLRFALRRPIRKCDVWVPTQREPASDLSTRVGWLPDTLCRGTTLEPKV